MADHPRSTPSRKPLLQDSPPAPETVATQSRVLVTGARATRQEAPPQAKSSSWMPVIVGLVVQMLVLAAALAWGANYLRQQTVASGTVTGSGSGSEVEMPSQNAIERANAQISALQRQLDAQEDERRKTQGRLQEMADRMALVIQQSSYSPSGEKPRVSSGDASQVAAMLPSVSPATAELLLIKERNRLTAYADKAIATGSRASLQALVEAMMDSDMQHLIHAAQAEFKRVQAYYDMGIGIDPGYTLPVREIFKDSPATRESDLSPVQLHSLLQDHKLPWEARLRAAFLLRSSTEAETNSLLLQALKEDPILDVAKQAQITFENRIGRKFRLFDIPAIEAWWQAQGGDKPAVKMIDPEK